MRGLQEVVGVWRNIHTADMATITDEPLLNVFELTYADPEKQLYDTQLRICRWSKKDLFKHWKAVHTNLADLESEEE